MEEDIGRRTPHLFDASAYLLFEASGDSEAQCFDSGALLMDLEPGATAEDDAQSCSYGSLSDDDDRHVGVHHDVDIDVSGDIDLRGDEEEDGGGGSEGEEDGVVDQCRRKEKAAKSNGCEDSNAKMMNEREGDRLFWEACLAS